MIETYCTNKFKYVNFIDFYYRKIDTNAVLMLLITIFCVYVLFIQITLLTKKILTNGIIDIKNKLQISSKIAALTLIAFLNASPEIIRLTGN